MKREATLRLTASGESIQRMPGFWDKLKKTLGARPNLDTDRVRTRVHATELVIGAKKAFERLGVDNAVSLSLDGKVLFEDTTGKAGDAPDLFLAFYENEDAFRGDFDELRLVVEHSEGGLHFVVEISAHGEHVRNDATAVIRIVADGDGSGFDAWVGRVEETLRATLPGTIVRA